MRSSGELRYSRQELRNGLQKGSRSAQSAESCNSRGRPAGADPPIAGPDRPIRAAAGGPASRPDAPPRQRLRPPQRRSLAMEFARALTRAVLKIPVAKMSVWRMVRHEEATSASGGREGRESPSDSPATRSGGSSAHHWRTDGQSADRDAAAKGEGRKGGCGNPESSRQKSGKNARWKAAVPPRSEARVLRLRIK